VAATAPRSAIDRSADGIFSVRGAPIWHAAALNKSRLQFMTDTSDHIAIQALISRYSSAVSRRDWGALEELFMPDATWEVIGGPGVRFAGAELAPGIRGLVEGTDTIFQMNSPAIIAVEGDRAVAQSCMYELGVTLDKSSRFEAPGIYDDVVVKRDGQWRFASRRYTVMSLRLARITE
jgi:hypothetical protein